jgi:hypothetical protein
MRIVTSPTFAALLSATTLSAPADEFEWGLLSTKPRDNRKTSCEAWNYAFEPKLCSAAKWLIEVRFGPMLLKKAPDFGRMMIPSAR